MKSFIRKDRLGTLMFAGALALMTARAAQAAPLNLSDVPLFLATGAEPNIMLMFDSSGSMTNILPEAPYDATKTYLASCTGGNLIAAGTSVDLAISSSQPRIEIGNNTYTWGTGTGQRCFATDSNYVARLEYPQGNYLGAVYNGNFLNWYFDKSTDPASGCTTTWATNPARKPCTKTRLAVAKTAGVSLVNSMPSGVRLALSQYNDTSGGKLLSTMGILDAAKKTSINNSLNAMVSSGATPLAETLNDIGYYFSRGVPSDTKLKLHPSAATPTEETRDNIFGTTRHSSWGDGSNPIQYRCQKSFAVLLTDGRPQEDRAVSSHLRDYLGECAAGKCNASTTTSDIPSGALTVTDHKNGTQIGRSYEPKGSDFLDDVAAALFEMDLRPDLTGKSPGQKNNVVTYIIGLADPNLNNDELTKRAAEVGGGEKYLAGSETELVNAFQSALSSIQAKIGTAASASVNSGSINSDTRLFQAVFDSGTWSGRLLAKSVAKLGDKDSSGNLIPEGTLGPEVAATIPVPGSRAVITVNGDGSKDDPFTGVPLAWASIDANRQKELQNNGSGVGTDTTARGQARLNWLRGSNVDEGTVGEQFRKRNAVLGDIVNSAPAYVGVPAFRYPDNLESKAYSAFRTTHKDRAHMVYVGANDGMLHAFKSNDAQADGMGSVVETLAFIPKTVFKNLYKLTDPSYTHQFYADGSPVIGDAFFGGAWRTMLVAGLNKGGQGIYALDITDPSAFGEGNADKIFKWEFTDEIHPDMGYSFSRPSIIRMNDGTWAAAFGNGYNNTVDDDADGAANDSTTGNAVLYIVNLETGALIHSIDTKVGTAQDPTGNSRPNGLSTPVFVDIDGDSDVDIGYAGDLFGNLWKFDLSSSTASSWAVAYSGKPLFTARKGASTYQPITSRPNVSRGPNGSGLMVVFGTGKYIEKDDTVLANIPDASFYGLYDANTGSDTDIIGARSTNLTQQTIITNSTTNLRTTSENTLAATHKGWYLDLLSTASAREMQVTDSLIRNGKVIFTTLIPQTTDACGAGGTSWLMELNLFTGARAKVTPFDLDSNGVFDDTTKVGGVDTPVSGVLTTVGITPKPAPLSGEKCDYLIFPGTSGSTETRCRNPGPRGFGRQSWRQAH